MAFITAFPPNQNALWQCAIPTDHRYISCASQQQSQPDLWNPAEQAFLNTRQTNSSAARNDPITQSAIQLNCYDNLSIRSPSPQEISAKFTLRCAPDMSLSRRNTRKQYGQSMETLQHRSMIDLDASLRANTLRDSIHCNRLPEYPEIPTIKWLQCHSPHVRPPGSSASMTSGFLRFSIHDLLQQESGMNPFSFPLDQPSRLVRIECRKAGCRCVLKNEAALALKIIPRVTLVQGNWILPTLSANQLSKNHRLGSCPWMQSNRTETESVQNPGTRTHSSDGSCLVPAPVILTTVCPSWFEMLHKGRREPVDVSTDAVLDVPVWTTGKALWRARPKLFLLRKPTKCMFAASKQAFPQNPVNSHKQEQLVLNVNADNVVNLKSGTVLNLLGCRLARLVHEAHTDNNTMGFHSPTAFIGRSRPKTVSMLQCAIVGDKVLADLASVATDIPVQDALHWFTDGPRLVYIPLDSKSLSCMPVSTKKSIKVDDVPGKMQAEVGVYSLVSLLTDHRLPVVVRPVSAMRPNEWSTTQRMYKRHLDTDDTAKHPLLHITSCYHGDLIFLEPLFDCQRSISTSGNEPNHQKFKKLSGNNSTSRFFVVTTDMLYQHNFFVAEAASVTQYERELETHASRVAYFLAACHPAQGLKYLLRHLEDITQSSNTGPSHLPLTRTLGPISRYSKYADMQSPISSLSAAAALVTEDLNECESSSLYYGELQGDFCSSKNISSSSLSHPSFGTQYRSSTCLLEATTGQVRSSLSSSLLASEEHQMNALCDEIEDIYYYVRNGQFPTQSRSMTSLAHHHYTPPLLTERLPQTSAPISPQPYSSTSARVQYVQTQKRSPKPGWQTAENRGEPVQVCAAVQQHAQKSMVLVPCGKVENCLRVSQEPKQPAAKLSAESNPRMSSTHLNGDYPGRFETMPNLVASSMTNSHTEKQMSGTHPNGRCALPTQNTPVESVLVKNIHTGSRIYRNKKVLNMSMSREQPDKHAKATIATERSNSRVDRPKVVSNGFVRTTFETLVGIQPRVVRVVPSPLTQGLQNTSVPQLIDLSMTNVPNSKQQMLYVPYYPCQPQESLQYSTPQLLVPTSQSQSTMVRSMNERSNNMQNYPTDSNRCSSSTVLQRNYVSNDNSVNTLSSKDLFHLGTLSKPTVSRNHTHEYKQENLTESVELHGRSECFPNVQIYHQNTMGSAPLLPNTYARNTTTRNGSTEVRHSYCTDNSRLNDSTPLKNPSCVQNPTPSSRVHLPPPKSVLNNEPTNWYNVRPIPMAAAQRQTTVELDQGVSIHDDGLRVHQFSGSSLLHECSNSSPDTGIGVDSGIDVATPHKQAVTPRYHARGNWSSNDPPSPYKEPSNTRIYYPHPMY